MEIEIYGLGIVREKGELESKGDERRGKERLFIIDWKVRDGIE